MTAPIPTRKWRPSLGLVVFVVLAIVAMLPLVALGVFRLFDNELVRQTERELIAQSAVFSAIVAMELEARAPGEPITGVVLPEDRTNEDERFRPLRPLLDFTRRGLLPPRPDAIASESELRPAYRSIGAHVSEVAERTQSITLAGFRLLDPTGRVFAGGGEIGLSLAHIDEVDAAINGTYSSVARHRSSAAKVRSPVSFSRTAHFRVFTAMPVVVKRRVAAVVYASRTPLNLLKYVFDERWALFMSAISVLIAVGLLGLVLLRTINGPIRVLLARTQALGAGDRDALQPLPHYGTREIAALSLGIFAASRRLFERSDYISTLAAHVSHELKSPLTSIRGAAELMRDSGDAIDASERRRFLTNIVEDAGRLDRLVGRLRDLARAENLQPNGCTTPKEILSQLEKQGLAGNVRMRGNTHLEIAIATENAAIVFAHLIGNAFEHDATEIDIDISENDTTVAFRISDNGTGISEKNRDRVFDAFFTTKRESGGTGMGLTIVRSLLEAHGGKIALEPAAAGCCFRVELPRSTNRPAAG